MRPKKKTPDQRGVLLKERPFSYRAAPGRHGRDPLEGPARDDARREDRRGFLEVAPTEDEQGQQLLMAKATGNFKRGNERKR